MIENVGPTSPRAILRLLVATLVCLAGLVVPTMFAATANADRLPNGLDATCTEPDEYNVICLILPSGCPRVGVDYVPDVVHVIYNHNAAAQDEIGFRCLNGETARYHLSDDPKWGSTSIVLSVQACRKVDIGGDMCSPFSDYTYVTNAPPPDVPCPPGSTTPTVPAGQKCTAAPKPDVQCPPGSKDPTVPAGYECIPPPVDQVRMKITTTLGSATADLTNLSYMAGNCSFDATNTNGVLPPVHRDVAIGPNGTATIAGLLAPPPLTTFHVVLSCKGDFWGRQIEFGHVEQDISG